MVPSPCINVCKMDEHTGLCQGCFRTLDEIAAWSASSDAARLDILARVAKRRQEHDPWKNDLRCNCDDGEE
ncbi:MAG TPA: DUF1289 domain-containing protein [Rhodocyclaceae bacterium]|nr:DUF1289 domain-containing protein [Rhodocyclaceae bacterium]